MLRLALQYVSQMHAPFLQAPSPAYRVCTNAIAHGLLSLDRMHSATGSGDAGAADAPRADRDQPALGRGWDSFALVKEVNGNLRKSGFPLRRGCFTTAFPSATSAKKEAGGEKGPAPTSIVLAAGSA